MTPSELSVLSVFRMYQVSAGRMLCFGGDDLEKFNRPLADLTKRGLLTAERFRGGYSLTDAGYAAMKSCES